MSKMKSPAQRRVNFRGNNGGVTNLKIISLVFLQFKNTHEAQSNSSPQIILA